MHHRLHAACRPAPVSFNQTIHQVVHMLRLGANIVTISNFKTPISSFETPASNFKSSGKISTNHARYLERPSTEAQPTRSEPCSSTRNINKEKDIAQLPTREAEVVALAGTTIDGLTEQADHFPASPVSKATLQRAHGASLSERPNPPKRQRCETSHRRLESHNRRYERSYHR